MEVVFPVERILKLATCIKLVKNEKLDHRRFSRGCICYVEPVEISSMCCLKDVKPIKKATLKLIKSFKYHHSTVGYKGKYVGPKVDECMFAILENLSTQQVKEMYNEGIAFSVKEISGLSFEDMQNLTTTVEIKVYKDKSGKIPDEILAQPVKYSGREFAPEEIKEGVCSSAKCFDLRTRVR